MSPHADHPISSSTYPASFQISPAYNESITSCSSSISNASTPEILEMEHPSRPLIPGLYVPTVCFFDPATEDLDTATIASHAVRLAAAGVNGLATQGSNGEAVHLSHDERRTVTLTTRKALNEAGYAHIPIIVGCGAQSTREAVQLCRDAYAAGGDYALVLPPSYYAGLFAAKSRTIVEFFTTVAEASPIPLLIYNYPGAVSGLDLSSDLIIELAQHPNIVGVKLTCGNTGKLNRVAAGTRHLKKTAADSTAPSFIVLGGSADFALQSLVAGGHGILAGLGNLAPKACIKTMALYRQGAVAEAQEMQDIVSRGDWVAIQGGVVGTKAGIQGCLGYGGSCRSPLPRTEKEDARKWGDMFRELMGLEKSL